MDGVRLLDEENPPPAPPGWGRFLVLVAAGVVAAAVLLLVRTPGVSSPDRAVPPELAAPATGAVAAVEQFHAALAAGDSARALELVGPAAEPLILPGLPVRFVPRDFDRDDLAAALEFYGAAMGPTATACRVEQAGPTVAGVGCVVRVSSPLAAAGGVADVDIPTRYTLVDDRIVAVLRSPIGTPDYEAYCHWVERTAGLSLGQAFDENCRPVPSADSVEVHRRLAEAFIAAGLPPADQEYRQARIGVGVVATIETIHNQGLNAAALTDAGRTAAGSFGLFDAGEAPSLGEAVEWSSIVYRIDTGYCSVDATGVELQVVCPAAAWSGPLVEGLGLDTIVHPATFLIDDVSVARVAGGTPEALETAFAKFCEWVREDRPETAPAVFSEECRPIYTADAARRLLVVLSGYTADPR